MHKKSALEIIRPAPVLNTPEFPTAFGGANGIQIPRNALGHPLHNEFVALPGMQFTIEEIIARHHHWIYRVRTPAYPSNQLYIDSRFTRPIPHLHPTQTTLPSVEVLAARMEKLLGTKYVWGGNWSSGIPDLLHLYPPTGPIDEETKTLWTLTGVDCSGLLYETTGGAAPRNTKELIEFGRPVLIEGKSPKDLAKELQPMDLVVWPGHMWFVLNRQFSIESKSPFGVIRRPLLERLEETCRERRGNNCWDSGFDPEAHFVVRRLT